MRIDSESGLYIIFYGEGNTVLEVNRSAVTPPPVRPHRRSESSGRAPTTGEYEWLRRFLVSGLCSAAHTPRWSLRMVGTKPPQPRRQLACYCGCAVGTGGAGGSQVPGFAKG